MKAFKKVEHMKPEQRFLALAIIRPNGRAPIYEVPRPAPKFWKGLMIGLPLALALWVLGMLAVIAILGLWKDLAQWIG